MSAFYQLSRHHIYTGSCCHKVVYIFHHLSAIRKAFFYSQFYEVMFVPGIIYHISGYYLSCGIVCGYQYLGAHTACRSAYLENVQQRNAIHFTGTYRSLVLQHLLHHCRYFFQVYGCRPLHLFCRHIFQRTHSTPAHIGQLFQYRYRSQLPAGLLHPCSEDHVTKNIGQRIGNCRRQRTERIGGILCKHLHLWHTPYYKRKQIAVATAAQKIRVILEERGRPVFVIPKLTYFLPKAVNTYQFVLSHN